MQEETRDKGIGERFVPADNEDEHALDFYLSQGDTHMTTTHVVLRDEKQPNDSRLLEAYLNAAGNVVIAGRDWGDSVEEILGEREYEWAWTIASADVPALLKALGATGNVLSALQERFSDDKAGELSTFLETQTIPTQRWSRLGE